MDVIAAINAEIFRYLRADDTLEGNLAEIMENKNIRVGRALRSDVFPYITFGIRPFVDPLMPLIVTVGVSPISGSISFSKVPLSFFSSIIYNLLS